MVGSVHDLTQAASIGPQPDNLTTITTTIGGVTVSIADVLRPFASFPEIEPVTGMFGLRPQRLRGVLEQHQDLHTATVPGI
jgi:hypothetical protein